MVLAVPLLLAVAASAGSVVAIPQCTPGPTIPPGNTNPVLLFTLSGTDPLAAAPSIPAASTSDPTYAAFDARGELFVANRFSNDSVNGSVSRFLVRPDGSFAPNGTITGNGLQNVHGVAVSPAGELFAANIWAKTISRFTFAPDGTAVPNGTFNVVGGGWPQGLAFSPAGDLYVADYQFTQMIRFRFTNGQAGMSGRFPVVDSSGLAASQISGVAFSPSGEMFVASYGNDRVYRFTFDANATPTAGRSFEVAGGPYGLAFTPAGELLVSSHRSGQISRFTFDASGNPVASGAPIPTSSLGGIAVHEFRSTRAPKWVWANRWNNGAETPAVGTFPPLVTDDGLPIFGLRPVGSLGSSTGAMVIPPAPGTTTATQRWTWGGLVDPPSIGGNEGYLYEADGYDRMWAYSLQTLSLAWQYGAYSLTFRGTPSVGPNGTLYPLWGTRAIGLSPDPTIPTGSLARVVFGPTGPFFTDPPAISGDGKRLYGIINNDTVSAYSTVDDVPGFSWPWTFTVPRLDPPEWQDVTRGHKYLSVGRDGTVYVTFTYWHTQLNYLFVELYALDPDPLAPVRVKWALGGNDLLGQGDALGPAVIGPDGVIYQATAEGIFTFDPSAPGAARRIFYPPGGVMTSNPAVGADGTVYVVAPYDDDPAVPGWYSTTLYALDPSGAVKWVTPAGWSATSAPPAFPTGPTIGPDGTVYFGSADGRGYAVAGETAAAPNGEWPMSLHDAKNTRCGTALVAGTDLVPTLVSSPPASAAAGDVFDVKDTTINAGAVAGATPTTTRYYLSTDRVRDAADVLVGSRTVPALPPGGRSTGSATATVPSAPGAYWLLACADDGGAQDESSEANNCVAATAWLLVGVPDLVETAVAGPPPTAAEGDGFAVTDTAVNQGTVTTAPSTTAFYLSLDAVADASDVLVGSRAVDALAPGAASAGSTTLTIPSIAPGVYSLLACADAGGVVTEGDEANNCALAAGTVTIAPPDLRFQAVANPPPLVAPGGTFTATDTLRNVGGVTAAASRNAYFLSVDALWSADDAALVGFRAVPALAPGEFNNGSAAVTVPSSTAAGVYRLIACADAGGAVAESDETNNCAAAAGAVTVGQPDLVVSAPSVSPPTAAIGSTLSVTDTVTNAGSAAAGASQTAYFLSVDALRSADDVALPPGRTVPALAAGASSSGTVGVTLPAVAPGAYRLLACADGGGAVAESDEANNCAAAAVTITAPDLTVSAVSNPPALGIPGGTFSVTDTTANGGGAAAAASQTAYFLSTDTARSAGDVALSPVRAVPALAAGGTSGGTVTVGIPSTARGVFYLLACADAPGAIAEANEANNCRASTTRTTVGPDLVVTTVGNPPASTSVGASFNQSSRTYNQGSSTTGVATTTRFYLSRDAVKDASDVRMTGSRAVGILAPGGASNGNAGVTVPAVPAGSYYVIACADDLAVVTEADEANNCRASAATTRIGPDLTVTSVTFTPTTRRAGDPLSITDSTRNTGASTTGVASVTRYYLSTDAAKDDLDTPLAPTRAVPILATTNATSTGTVSVTLPSVAPGAYRVIACADDGRVVAEVNEGNNCLAAAATLTIQP